MNKDRRARIEQLSEQLEDVFSTFHEQAERLIADLKAITNEEQDYLDNMPENLQDGDAGAKAQEAIEALEEAESELSSLLFDGVSRVTEHLTKAHGD